MKENTSTSIERLSIEDERRLIEDAKARNPEALDALWQAYQPTIGRVLRQFRQSDTEIEDLRQEAYVAFLGLIDEHDPSVTDRLAGRVYTYLDVRLTAAVGRQTSHWSIPPRTLRRYFGILRRADHDVTAGAALAPNFAMTSETFLNIAAVINGTGSLSGYAEDDEQERVVTNVQRAEIVGAEPKDAFLDADDALLAQTARKALDPEQRNIIDLAFGFIPVEYDGAIIDPPVSDAIVGEVIGMTRPTVQRKRTAALKTMREALGLAEKE